MLCAARAELRTDTFRLTNPANTVAADAMAIAFATSAIRSSAVGHADITDAVALGRAISRTTTSFNATYACSACLVAIHAAAVGVLFTATAIRGAEQRFLTDTADTPAATTMRR